MITAETITGSSWQRAIPAARKRIKERTDLRHAHFAEVAHKLEGNRLEVHQALLSVCQATGSELAARIGWPVTSVRPRICELREMGLVETTGDRRNGEHVMRVVRAESQGELF